MNPTTFLIQSELRRASIRIINWYLRILMIMLEEFPSAFFIYFQLVYHFLNELRGQQNEELLDRVQSSELCLIFLEMI